MSQAAILPSLLPSTLCSLRSSATDELHQKTRLTSCISQQVISKTHGCLASCRLPRNNKQIQNSAAGRRAFVLGGAGLLPCIFQEKKALAAKRKPSSEEEERKPKNDTNVGGVQAKVIASKKRKEAMKAALAKLKEQGKSSTKDTAE